MDERRTVSSHALNFEEIIYTNIVNAYENQRDNRGHGLKGNRLGTARHKKSPFQSGAAAVACLLIFIYLEGSIRHKAYFRAKSRGEQKNAFNDGLAKLADVVLLCPPDKVRYSAYIRELELVRSVIAHGYLFEGIFKRGEQRKFIALEEAAIAGRRSSEAKSRYSGSGLYLHLSPMQIGFFDAAKFYLSAEIVLRMAGYTMPEDFWGSDQSDEPVEWLNNAVRSLKQAKGAWTRLIRELDDIKYRDFQVNAEGYNESMTHGVGGAGVDGD